MVCSTGYFCNHRLLRSFHVGPFAITSSDIENLRDGQLRDVLRLFLEAEAIQYGIPLSSIRLGGDQNAADNGVDARVEWDGGSERTEWLPRRLTIFQSKAEVTPPSRLNRELAPKGTARSLFAELASRAGAYVIFSTDNCTEAMYSARIDAMRSAVADVFQAERMAFDFYDASRIARWANCYQGVSNHVRTLVGRPMVGWRPFENWSAPLLPTSQEYFVDDKPKVTFPGLGDDPGLIGDAVFKVREHLRQPGRVVRLIGVSGVGKTRFAQALFDARIGQTALNAGNVVYGDLGQSPSTTASQIAEQLVHSRQHAVLIVDNCPGDTHRALASIIQRPGSCATLLTIDFDVGRDQPDNTLVVQLHQNGDRLIEGLLIERARRLSPLDRDRVVRFAGGNARVALTIADNSSAGAGLANLSDRVLVERLFLDGKRPTDNTLRRCAEVASLVYAFHVDAEKDQEPEHPILAELADVSPSGFYRAVAEFVDRGTAQKRGTQRAMLPQAFAIQLATRALERLAPDAVRDHFFREGRERLLRSFTRRLGDLHQSEAARNIAGRLLGQDGPLSDPTSLNDLGVALFENLAPVSPDMALTALEGAISGPNSRVFTSLDHPNRRTFALLARKIAYDSTRFERAARVLLAFAKEEPEDHNRDAVSSFFLEMFWLRLSWTQATPEQRYAFLDRMLTQGDAIDRRLAVQALEHALGTGPWSSSYHGQFGSRAMGQEWRPKKQAEQDQWFRDALDRLAIVACQDGELADQARDVISRDIRGLIRIGLIDDLGRALLAIRTKGYCSTAWRRFCEALHFDRRKWPPQTQAKAQRMVKRLRPKSVKDRFATYVTAEPWGFYLDDTDSEVNGMKRASEAAERFGQEVSKNPTLWPLLARRACAFKGASNCRAFGRGLAKGAGDVRARWEQLVSIFKAQEAGTRNAAVLAGFLNAAAATAPDDVQTWLDESVTDNALGAHIVELTFSSPIDRRSIVRLSAAVRAGKAPTETFAWLQGGRATDATPADVLAEFLRTLSATGYEGAKASAHILEMYMFGRRDGEATDSVLLEVGRDILRIPHLYEQVSDNDAYTLAAIAKHVLAGSARTPEAREVFMLLLETCRASSAKTHDLRELIKALTALHPATVVAIALENDDTAEVIGEEVFGCVDDDPDSTDDAFINETRSLIMDWVEEESSTRAVRVARLVRYYRESDRGPVAWTPIAIELIRLDDVGINVLKEFYKRFFCGSGWGRWSDQLVRRRPLLEVLTGDTSPSIRSWASDALAKLNEYVANEIERERVSDERFE